MYAALTQEIKNKASAKLANNLATNIEEVLSQLYGELKLENEEVSHAKKLVDDVLDAIADGSITPQKVAGNDDASLEDGDEEILLKPANPTMYDWLTDNPATKEFYVYRSKKVYEYKTDGRIPLESVAK